MSEPETPEGDQEDADADVGAGAMRASLLSVFFAGLCFTMVGFAVGGTRTAFGVLIGGLIATANLWVFARVAEAFMKKRGSTAPWGIIAMLKITFLFGGVWLILRTGVVSPLSLVAGYAALPVGIVIGSLFGPSPSGPGDDQTPPAQRRGNVLKGAERKGRR